jgi:hypothetical protein
MDYKELPIPPHFNPDKVGDIWRIPYQERAERLKMGKAKQIKPAASDRFQICLLPVDVQNTFVSWI